MRAVVTKRIFNFIFIPAFSLVLVFAAHYHYLLFHYLTEMFSIIVAGSIFIITWNSKNYFKNGFFIFIGISYFFMAGFDLLHTLSYEGMNVFPTDGDYATKLWISARLIESATLVIAFFFLKFKPTKGVYYIKTIFIIISTLLLLSIFQWDMFPTCLNKGEGLTKFKIISEYFIIFLLGLALTLLLVEKERFDNTTFKFLLWSIILTAASELSFTLYVKSNGTANMVGHFFKILSFYMIYKAIIETGIRTPHKIIFRDMKKNEMMLERLARTDSLTGLLNRRAFMVIFDYERAISTRVGKENAIIMGDIDHFKEVNDKYGHHLGDMILKEIADIFYNNLRQQDSICRWGGEEFVILLPGVKSKDAQGVAEKLRLSIEKHPFRYNEQRIYVTISFGVSRFDPVKSLDDNLEIVDSYLYQAKEAGRNRISFEGDN